MIEFGKFQEGLYLSWGFDDWEREREIVVADIVCAHNWNEYSGEKLNCFLRILI